jgi:predicted transcriptional regulator
MKVLNSLMDRINTFLNKEYEIDTTKFEEVVTNLLKRFKSKLKIITIIASILVGSYMTINKVRNFDE